MLRTVLENSGPGEIRQSYTGVFMRDVIFKLEHVSKYFTGKAGEIKAVDDISLEIERGEIFGIIGMSGAGKSTLVRLLNRLEDVTSGTVYFDGQDLSLLSKRELCRVRQSMAMIFQSFNLMTQKNILKNVEAPMKIAKIHQKERTARAFEMLKVVGLEDKAKAYPAELSGGQKQRAAIARALTMNPKVLLCDEATSALDPKITGEILALLKDINKNLGITIVLITHEMSVVEKICGRVAIVENGRIAETGPVKDIFANPKSGAARKLILPNQQLNTFDMTDRRCLRLVFDGRCTDDPLLSELVQQTGEKVNILAANTRSVDGTGFGQMIIELPKDEAGAQKIIDFLNEKGVIHSEIIREEDEEEGE